MSRAPRSHKFTGSQSRSITLTINDVLPSRPPPPSIHSLSDFSHRYFQPAGTSDDPHNETDKNFPPGSVRFMTNGAFVGRFKTSDTVSTGRIPKSSPFLTQSVGQKATPVLTVYPSSVGGSKVYQLVKDEVQIVYEWFTWPPFHSTSFRSRRPVGLLQLKRPSKVATHREMCRFSSLQRTK